MLCNVNIWALLVSSVASLVIAGLWYSDFAFGKMWRSYNTNLFTMPTGNMAKLYAGQFVLSLITNFVLARVLFYAGAATWVQGVSLAIAVWLGFMAAVSASAIIWEKKPWKLVAITEGSYLVTLVVSSIIFTLWS